MESMIAGTTTDFKNVLGVRNAEAMIEVKDEFGFGVVLFVSKDSVVILVKYFARLKMEVRDSLADIFDLIVFEGRENRKADAMVISIG